MTRTARAVIEELLDGVASGRRERLPELYAEDAVVEHPMHPARIPALRGRAELAEHFRAGGESLAGFRFRPADLTVHQTTDPEVVIAEFAYRGTNAAGEPFAAPCVFVMRVRDGLIVESRDYGDHAALARARGQVG